MIYTVTLNPSLDYVVRVPDLEPGNLHRTESEALYVGGKGINVSAVLKQLGVESICLGFTGGFTGGEIMTRLQDMGIASDFVTVAKGMSRINVKLKSKETMETEINGQGPEIDTPELELLRQKLERLRDGDILVLSGSAPGKLIDRDYVYANICDRLKNRKYKLVVDSEGMLLRNTLRYRPFLIKPNLQELQSIFDQALSTEKSIITCARLLQEEGAHNVLVSLAGEGAILLDTLGRVLRLKAPQGKVLNSVGAGDALIAGFLYGLLKSGKDSRIEEYTEEDYQDALKFGVATGSAAAFSEGFPSKDNIEELYRCL